jgi:hypothetical protein
LGQADRDDLIKLAKDANRSVVDECVQERQSLRYDGALGGVKADGADAKIDVISDRAREGLGVTP